jgi:predicted Zn-dependent peptidase
MRLLSVMLLICGCALAAEKETPPAGGPAKPFKLPPTEDFTLPNGMKVTLVPYGEVPRVAIRAYVNAGSVHEPSGQVWISKLTGQLMKEGTITRSASDVARGAADMGGSLDVDPRSEFTSVGGVVLSEFGPKFVGLLADVIQNPLFPASELARIKADLARDRAVDTARPQTQANELFMQTLLPDQPYSRLFPTEASLAGYTLQQVKAFYGSNFGAARTHLYVAGKLDPGLRPAIEAAFRDWSKGSDSSVPPPKPVNVRSLKTIDRPGAEQSTLYLGLAVPDATSQDFVSFAVLDSLLGGSFASRITANIREQKGYTYSPQSVVLNRHHFAAWIEIADVTTAVTGPSIKEIFNEIDRVRKDSPSAGELKGIQNYMAGLFLLRNTISPDAIIGQLHFVDGQELPRSYLSDYVPRVMAVKPSDIQRLAEQYLSPGKMTIVVVGDKAKIGDQIKEFEK